MSLHLTAADLAVILGPVTGLLGLWLRLSWRTRQEYARRATLVDLAETLRPGCELVEHAADGTQLRITAHGTTVHLDPAPAHEPPEATASSALSCGPPSATGAPWAGAADATIIVEPNRRR